MADHDPSRRNLIKTLAFVPVAAVLARQGVALAATPHLQESDPQAKALGYKNASPVPGKTCGGCQFWKGAAAPWGACMLFPGKEVAKGGHCNSWTKGKS